MLGSSVNRHLRVIIPILLIITIVISSASVALFTIIKNDNESANPTDNSVSLAPTTPPPTQVAVEKKPISKFHSITVIPGKDFFLEDETEETARQQIEKIIETANGDGFDALEITLNYGDKLIYSTAGESNENSLLAYFSIAARRKGLKIIGSVDIAALAQNHIADSGDIKSIAELLSHSALGQYCDTVILQNCYITKEQIPEAEYQASGSKLTYDEYLKERLASAVEEYYFAVAKSKQSMAVGIEINESVLPENAVFDAKYLYDKNIADFFMLYNPYSTETDDISFMTYYESVRETLGVGYSELHCKLAYDKIGGKDKGWEQTDQILSQLKVLDTLGVTGFTLNSYDAYANDKTESRTVVKKYLANLIADDYILRELSVSKPTKTKFTTTEKTVLLMGASDPEFSLKLNGEELERTEFGYFSLDLELNDGLNTFKLEHKGVTQTYKITFDRIVIKEIFPTKTQRLPSRSTLSVSCTALIGSTVTAALGDLKIALTESPIIDGNGIEDAEYSSYSGNFELPLVYDENKTLGKITFTAKSKYGTESKKSENIIVLKEERPVNSDTSSSGVGSGSDNAPDGGTAWEKPTGGNYLDINTGYIAEIINYQAEMFDANATRDYSRPTNNYLPKGTVDYCQTSVISTSGGQMRNLRYGKMTYASTSTLNYYYGTLPDHNTVNVASITNTGRHTELILDTLWKAPFYFDLAPQNYPNNKPKERDYTITAATYAYIDITFCYTTLVGGDIAVPADNPIFSKAEWFKNESDYTLRLYLKKVGKFYGWSAEYNEKNQLVFRFLNPAKITAADNSYGYRLDGVKILIDVGHGGSDEGAHGFNKEYPEAVLNLILAKMLKAELESIGATVYMTREDNETEDNANAKRLQLRELKPDFCISIHRNASNRDDSNQNASGGSSKPQGFISYHFNAYSSDAAKLIYKATEDANLYNKSKWSGTKWHVYYMGRMSDCPVVLTENGFMTNAAEYNDMIKPEFNQKCAVALAQGIVNYFKSIQ